ncbi:MAG TPA: transmembrane 220 family protein [Chitinophagaceae bacterium]|nr:transmembrane 220 family protein [Chitinophagaceae bacterium]
MKIFNWFFIFCFIVFAALQYNDPDPYVWMPIYLYAAFLCWQSIKGKFNPLLYWIGYIVYGAYALYKVFDANGLIDWITKDHMENIAGTMKAETPWVEETREFFGLVIVITVLLINHIYLSRRKKKIV